MNGYVMHSPTGEILLVVRGMDEELLYHIIKKLQSDRNKDIKELGLKLEEELNDKPRRTNGKAEPSNASKVAQRKRDQGRKTASPQRRTQ